MFRIIFKTIFIGLLASFTAPFKMAAYAIKNNKPVLLVFSIFCNSYSLIACVVLWFMVGWQSALIAYAIVSVISIGCSIAAKKEFQAWGFAYAEQLIKNIQL